MLRVTFSPAPECVEVDCWNQAFQTPRATRTPLLLLLLLLLYPKITELTLILLHKDFNIHFAAYGVSVITSGMPILPSQTFSAYIVPKTEVFGSSFLHRHEYTQNTC